MKRIKFTKRTGLISMILITALGLGACSAHHGHHRGLNTDKILKRTTKKLNLNSMQQSKLQEVLETAANFKQNMSTKHDEFTAPLKKNLSQPVIDVDQLNMHFDAFESDLNQFRRTMITQYADFHASLDDEQRLRLSGFIEKLEKHKRH